MLAENIEFYFNEDGDIVLDKGSFEEILNVLNQVETIDEKSAEKVFGSKKQYCCTVRFNGDCLEQYEYKEYPALAHLVCIRNTLNRCGSVNGCSGNLSKGDCDGEC
ncbi:hypothetical protein [Bacillus cereus]|uniref:hypothetical protein n=1 Tax=Bacillus cereus TaxID=1396 RepID=UPI0011A9DD52|nr:hypothetical protein [Bacillus cereus]HDR4686637.1 hypothetical protein [Bacillus cereus]